ncbi:hypothetical protein Poli38472_007992 [Pythium oligandrum]|uniref:Uncharacterized protein n=1 Tax=Pythium oligandrum TaxID=41045 RepID=A0A8K1CLA6_PYTOL|nr:hypothetical protein Poli38472_007992 [Pythium oligandrum]|eukprot:TMW65350.1 hypothetical protein Poli38472_007992 [Pythium oligandrum]
MERDGGPQRKKRRVVLSEEMASTLVAEWCGSLRGVIAPRLPEYHGFEVDYPAMELHLCCCQPLRTDPFEAVRIRGAIEFLNALATIPGFDPAENRGFWYRLIKSMTARYQCGANQLMRLPFKSNAFGKFHVFYSCTDQAVDNNVDVASYLQLLTSSAESSLSMKERAEALESLRYYLPTVSKSPTMAYDIRLIHGDVKNGISQYIHATHHVQFDGSPRSGSPRAPQVPEAVFGYALQLGKNSMSDWNHLVFHGFE